MSSFMFNDLVLDFLFLIGKIPIPTDSTMSESAASHCLPKLRDHTTKRSCRWAKSLSWVTFYLLLGWSVRHYGYVDREVAVAIVQSVSPDYVRQDWAKTRSGTIRP